MSTCKLLCIGMLLSHLTCILMDNEALKDTRDSDPAPDYEKNAGRKPSVMEKLKSWLNDFKEYLWDLIKTSVPPVAIIAFFISTMLLGSICCLTLIVDELM
ncbi:small integral membrane protein 9 [Sorex fumeus]|uniref:small integral membrane protein 9 n=1 Tax=Sorex fumeus TaxID=62283 RepID=UPI0024AE2594|nr:small integral membrane protein 9 [Sorex fumeus]